MQDLSYSDVKKQSLAVFGQFGKDKWIPFAKENAKHQNRRDCKDLAGHGTGKTLLCVGMGASLEDKIDIIKKYRDKVDIVTCDKGFQALMSHGVKPDYVMVCDCNVVWQKWGPSEADTENVAMIATPYANVAWTRKWRGPIYFYVNRDAIDSQDVFLEIMGPGTRMVPASSNVSNAMLVFFTGMDEWDRKRFSGYERFLLVGYDYSWKPDRNYYAWANPKPKRFYMNHKVLIDHNGDLVYTSENLLFSARWLSHYLRAWSIDIFNCSDGILECKRGKLEDILASIKPADGLKLKAARDTFNAVIAAAKSVEKNYSAAREEYLYGSR